MMVHWTKPVSTTGFTYAHEIRGLEIRPTRWDGNNVVEWAAVMDRREYFRSGSYRNIKKFCELLIERWKDDD